MFLIIGYVVILAASLGSYAIHGSLLALWVPAEYVAIVGLTVGGFLAGNDNRASAAGGADWLVGRTRAGSCGLFPAPQCRRTVSRRAGMWRRGHSDGRVVDD